MHTREARLGWRHGWVMGLAVLSSVVPVAAAVLRQQTVAALVLGLVSALAALIGAWWLTPAWARRLSLVLAILGVLISGYLLWVQIGLCGAGVLSGMCTP